MSAPRDARREESVPGWTRPAALAVTAFALLYFALGVWQLQDRTVDDGFIFFRLARHFVDGHGIVWNLGGEPTEGATNFLHFAALSAAMLPGLDPRIASLLVSSLSAVLAYLLVLRVLGRRLGPMLPAGAAVLALYLVDERVTINAAVGGLGTLIDGLAAVLAWLAALGLLRSPTRGRAGLFAAASVLASIARPTGALFAAVLFLVLLASAVRESRGGHRRALRAWWTAAVLTGVGGIAFAVFKLATFGYLLPNSYYLKSGADAATDWGAMGEYLAWILVPLALPLAAAAAFVTRDGLRELFAEPGTRTRVLATLLPPAAVVLYYVSSTVVSTANFRFFFPSFLFFFVGAAAVLSACRRGSPSLRGGAVLAAALAAVGVGVWRGHTQGLLRFPPERAEMRPLEKELARIGKALATTGLGSRATLLNDSAGAIPYFSGFRHIDRGGLVDNHLSGREPLTGLEREEYVWAQDPDVYIGWEPQASQGAESFEEDPRVYTPYVKICLVREARDATTLRTFARTLDLLHLRMRELRDRWRLIGQLEPVGYWEDAWNVKCLAYVRRDSPHREAIAAALQDLVEIRPREVDWQRVPKGAEIEFLDRLFEETDGDFSRMAERFLGDRRLAPLVRSRYRMLH